MPDAGFTQPFDSFTLDKLRATAVFPDDFLEEADVPTLLREFVLDLVQVFPKVGVLLFGRAHQSPELANAIVRFHLILGHGETTAFRARHRLLGVEVAFLEVAGHQVQLDHSRASEDVVFASERRSRTYRVRTLYPKGPNGPKAT